jgi:hypothetical protein
MRLAIDHDRMRQLHSAGLTDNQIAAEMSIGLQNVRGYRLRLGLRVNRKHIRQQEWRDYQFSSKMGDPMETALTPRECETMREFLHELIRCANQKRPGQTADVNRFLREYTGR